MGPASSSASTFSLSICGKKAKFYLHFITAAVIFTLLIIMVILIYILFQRIFLAHPAALPIKSLVRPLSATVVAGVANSTHTGLADPRTKLFPAVFENFHKHKKRHMESMSRSGSQKRMCT